MALRVLWSLDHRQVADVGHNRDAGIWHQASKDLGAADMQEKTLRRYLLGLARPEEQVEIEHWLIDQHDSYDLINAAEDHLIDDSLAENLKADDLERFNSHFLITEERRRKVQFARSLRRLRDSVGNRVPDPKPRSCGG